MKGFVDNQGVFIDDVVSYCDQMELDEYVVTQFDAGEDLGIQVLDEL